MFQFLKGFWKRTGRLNKTCQAEENLPETSPISTAQESGRTMLEMLAVLSVMALVVIGGVAAYKKLALKSESRTITQFIFTHVLERQHEALTNKGRAEHSKTNVAGPHGVFFDIRNIPNRRLIEIIIKSDDIELINSVHTYFRNGYENSPSHPATYRVHNPSLGDGQYRASLYMTFPQFTEMAHETIQSLNPDCPSGSSVDGLGDFVQNAPDNSPCYTYCPSGQFYVNNQCLDCRDVDNYLADGSETISDESVCCPDGYSTAVGGVCCKDSDPYCRQVEYLQAGIGSYIDTMYSVGSSVFKTELDVEYVSGDYGFIGTGTLGVKGQGVCLGVHNGKWSAIAPGNYWEEFGTATTDRVQFTWEINENTEMVSGYDHDTLTSAGHFGTSAFWRGLNIKIPLPNMAAKYYSVKIYDNGTLVRDFVPVLDRYGKACMYNAVAQEGEKTLYCNSSGSGTFTAGPVVEQ